MHEIFMPLIAPHSEWRVHICKVLKNDLSFNLNFDLAIQCGDAAIRACFGRENFSVQASLFQISERQQRFEGVSLESVQSVPEIVLNHTARYS
jgi:hypothetical protein